MFTVKNFDSLFALFQTPEFGKAKVFIAISLTKPKYWYTAMRGL